MSSKSVTSTEFFEYIFKKEWSITTKCLRESGYPLEKIRFTPYDLSGGRVNKPRKNHVV